MALAALSLGLAATGCSRHPQVVIHAAHGAVPIHVEIAETPDSRARGLMYRRDLGADDGMLFIFPAESEQHFWMKNTPLPLDMIFIDSKHTVVGIVAEARPFSTNPVGVGKPSQYVLEVNGGFAAQHGIGPGNAVDFVGIDDHAQ